VRLSVPVFLIERSYAEKVEANAEAADGVNRISNEESVRWLYSFLSTDNRKTYCLYEAPSPDAIRRAAERAGLPADVVVEVSGRKVVLADGRTVTASESEHPGLFWALRGSGGNFGVVTAFVFWLHPVSTVVAGPTVWPLAATSEVLSWYRDFLPAQHEDL
jgi:hypothetical protein